VSPEVKFKAACFAVSLSLRMRDQSNAENHATYGSFCDFSQSVTPDTSILPTGSIMGRVVQWLIMIIRILSDVHLIRDRIPSGEPDAGISTLPMAF
jgi:hypothetical protein